MENRKSHNEFVEEAKEANALPAQTCRALGPESEEDIAMYAEESNKNDKEFLCRDALCETSETGGEKDGR